MTLSPTLNIRGNPFSSRTPARRDRHQNVTTRKCPGTSESAGRWPDCYWNEKLCHRMRSGVILDHGGFRETSEPFANLLRPLPADPLDLLQVVQAGGEQHLQRAEALHHPVDHPAGELRHLGEHPVAARNQRDVERTRLVYQVEVR